MAQWVKNPPAIQETQVQSLGWEDPLEEGMAAHSSILPWENPMNRGAWQATVHGIAKLSLLPGRCGIPGSQCVSPLTLQGEGVAREGSLTGKQR